MKAVVCENAEPDVLERPEPVPRRGQGRIQVLRCGITAAEAARITQAPANA